MPTQKNSATWDLQLGFNLAFKRLTLHEIKVSGHLQFLALPSGTQP